MVRSLRSGLKSICAFALLSLAAAAPPPLAAQTTGSTWQLIDPPPSGEVSSQSVSGEAKTVYVIDGQAGVAASPLPQEFKDQLVPPTTSGTVTTSSEPDDDVYIVGKEIVDGILASEAAGALTPEIEAIAEPLDGETTSASTYSGDGINSVTANSIFDCATHEKVVNRVVSLTDKSWNKSFPDLGGGFSGSLNLTGDLEGQANLEVKFNIIRKKVLFKCVPWSAEFKSARVHGNATSDEGVTLTGTLNYTTKLGPWNVAKPELFSVTFPVGPIPVTIGFNLPIIAGLDLTAAVTGTVNYNGTHVATGTFDYTCTVKTCTGSSNFNNVGENGATQTITGGVDGRIKPTPWVDVAFRAYLYTEWFANAQVGVRPHFLGDLWGYTGNFCGDAAADGHFETVRALTFDLDTRIDWTGEAGAFGKKRWGKTLKTGTVSHFGFWDVSGNSTAMQPHFHGTSSFYTGDAGGNKVRMRPCWPYTENVTYQINWGDGSATQEIQGAPATELTPNHTWTTAGTRTASATAVKDAHGRTINQSTSRTIEVKAITPLGLTVTQAPASATYGVPLNLTATATGGHVPTIQYTLGRRRVGTLEWQPVPLVWQAGNVLSWTPTAADLGNWELAAGVKDKTTAPDANGLGYAASALAGTVQVVPPLVLSCPTVTQRTVTSGTTVNWSGISSTGGTPGTIQYTHSRQLTGNANNPWLPNPLVWQANTAFTWTPTASDLGTWQFHAMAKDVNSPANPGYTSTCNMGQIVVVSPLTVSVTPSPATSIHGNQITWTANASGGTPATTKFAWFRRKAGASAWTPDVSQAVWGGNTYTWTPGATDVGDWEIVVWVKDGNTPANTNTYGYASYANAGTVKVVPPPLTLSVTVNPTQVVYGNPVTITATASGGTPATIQYAFFRRRAGTTTWTPDVTAPAWQTSNTSIWNTTSADIGTWDIYVWVKDANTPPTQNTYGYGAGANGGTVKVVTPPLTLTSTPSPATVYHSLPITWTATTGGGTPATTQVALLRRRVGSTTWIPSPPAWQTSKTLSWTPATADVGSWEILIVVKDGDTPSNQNTLGYATGYSPGTVQVVNPPTLNVTMSPSSVNAGTTITWTASSNSSNPASVRYAFFRRRSGTTTWSPSVNNPTWQTSNTHTWPTTSADVGDWDTYVWVKDAYTPASMNTYGYAAGFNTGGVRVVTPITYLTCSANRSGAYHGTAFTWSANVSGGDSATLRYALLRRKVGTTTWIPAQTSPSWQSGSSFSWTPSSSETGSYEVAIWVKDGNTASNQNTYGYALSCNPGTIQVLTPPTVSGTSSPAQSPYGATISWTATGSGGDSGSYRYAIFRRRAGTSAWTPDVNSPSWQTGRTFSWTPTSADVGTWEVFIWLKDAYTPSNMNTYGHAAWYNAGNVEVTTPAPVTVSGTGSPSTSPAGTTITWTATASGGIPGTYQYALFRRKAGTSNWIPDVTAPAWQTSRTMSWTPTANDVGTWEIIVWVKDTNTSSTQNTYGYAAYYNAQPVQVY